MTAYQDAVIQRAPKSARQEILLICQISHCKLQSNEVNKTILIFIKELLKLQAFLHLAQSERTTGGCLSADFGNIAAAILGVDSLPKKQSHKKV